MRNDPGPVSIEDLRNDGVLLEINRRVLHPVGLELGLDGSRHGPLVVCRAEVDSPGTLAYLADGGLALKASAFRALEATEHQARFAALGYLVQPFPNDPPRTVAAFTADLDGIWAFIEGAAGEVAARAVIPLANWGSETLVDAVAEQIASVLPTLVVAPLLGRLSLVSTNGGATYEWRLQPEPVLDDEGSVFARCEYLVAEIQRLQHGGAVDFDAGPSPVNDVTEVGAEIREYVQRAKGELYDHEWHDFEEARAALNWSGVAGVSDDGRTIDEVHATLERLYEAAQPGMRVYRGDPDAREAFEAHRVRLKAAANSARDRMTDYERLTAGELGDYEAADWPALDARLAREIEDATRACSEAERALNDAVQARDRAQRGMAVVARALARAAAPTPPAVAQPQDAAVVCALAVLAGVEECEGPGDLLDLAIQARAALAKAVAPWPQSVRRAAEILSQAESCEDAADLFALALDARKALES